MYPVNEGCFISGMRKIVIFTDLDGTLLHSDTYSFEDARPALLMLKKREIPLVLCSSKTRSEIERYRREIGNIDPFVSENGGGIFIPNGYFRFPIDGVLKDDYRVITLGVGYREIRKIFKKVKDRTGIRVRGFGDMTPEEVASITGMSVEDSLLAKEREFDEPFIFEEGEERIWEFLRSIEDLGLHWTRGRLYHILGDNDKGKAITILKRFFERDPGDIITIGLGDSFNDLPLLQNVSYPVLIKKKDGSYEKGIDIENLIRADVGPAGWNDIVKNLIKKLS